MTKGNKYKYGNQDGLAMESIASAIPTFCWWKDLEGRYLGCGDSIAETLGFSAQEIVGKTDHELKWSDQPEYLINNDKEVIKNGLPVRVEEIVKTKNGDILTFLVIKSPVRDMNGNVIGIIGNSVDITNQKKLEASLRKAKDEAEANNKVKSEFIRNLEHDIRTPCSGISQLAKLLVAKATSPEMKELASYIEESANQLLGVLRGISEISKVEASIFPQRDKNFDLKDLIASVIAFEQPSAKAKNLSLEAYYVQSMPRAFFGDVFRIHRILLNLVGNAIKFTETGSVKIKTELVGSVKESNVVVKLTVEDTGTGIPEKACNLLFENTIKGGLPEINISSTGSGLGLRIVKQFTKDLGGDIQINTVMGGGTAFSIIIPLKQDIT